MLYNPKTVKLLTFYDKIPSFFDGSDTPRDYLERCIENIEDIINDIDQAIDKAKIPSIPGIIGIHLSAFAAVIEKRESTWTSLPLCSCPCLNSP